ASATNINLLSNSLPTHNAPYITFDLKARTSLSHPICGINKNSAPPDNYQPSSIPSKNSAPPDNFPPSTNSPPTDNAPVTSINITVSARNLHVETLGGWETLGNRLFDTIDRPPGLGPHPQRHRGGGGVDHDTLVLSARTQHSPWGRRGMALALHNHEKTR